MATTLERACRLINDLGQTSSPEEYARVVVDGIWDLLPNDETTFNDIDVYARRTHVLSTRSILPQMDPGPDLSDACGGFPYRQGLGPGEPGVIRMSDVVPSREIDRFPFYRQVMAPYGIDHAVKVSFASPPTIRRAVIVVRTDRDFTDRDCDLLALLAPHLEAEYRRARSAGLLTPREREVLSLVRQGLTNRQIARRLGITPGTVRSHLEHAFAKLGVGTRTAAAVAVS
ncbi:MAG: response regulator transcription factor [Actinomycetota bacterium]